MKEPSCWKEPSFMYKCTKFLQQAKNLVVVFNTKFASQDDHQRSARLKIPVVGLGTNSTADIKIFLR